MFHIRGSIVEERQLYVQPGLQLWWGTNVMLSPHGHLGEALHDGTINLQETFPSAKKYALIRPAIIQSHSLYREIP